MTSREKARVLCVDDEAQVVEGLKLQLRKVAKVETAGSGDEGLGILASGKEFDVVVSDMRMPGMSGAEFLATVRDRYPATRRILLTGQADMESTVAAVNEGGIYRFLMKPCPKEVLCEAVQEAAEAKRLRNVERELMEGTLRGALGVMSEILAIVSPLAFQRTMRIEAIVQQLAVALEVSDPWEFQVAATLSQIGCVSLPLEILDCAAIGGEMDEKQRESFEQHPELAFELVSKIPRLESISEMVRKQLEPTPIVTDSPIDSWPRVDLGAELLRLASDVDREISKGSQLSQAIGLLSETKGYPQPLLDALRGVELERVERVAMQVSAENLAAGMILDRDAKTAGGVVLAAKGTEITATIAKRLRNFAANSGLVEPLHVMAAARS